MLYEDFFKSSCDWRKSTIYRSVTNTIENKKSGRRKWLTRQQMIPIFDNDEAVVDGIILRKESDPELRETECRKHPEVPSMFQYLVLVEDSEEASETDRIMDKFCTTERDGDDDGDSSSSDGSDDDDESTDSDGGSKKKKKTTRKDSKKRKAMFFWHCIVPAGRIVIMHCSTCTCTMYICGLNSKKIKYVCSAIIISRGRARSLRRRDLRIRKPKEGLGRVSLEITRGRIKRRTRKQKRRRKLPSFWLKTPRRSGCTLYPEHNPLVSLCKAIGDINTRVRQANEKIKTMTAWHLVKNKWGHSYRIYIITTSSYNHAKKLNTTDPKGGKPSNTDLFNESNTIDHDSSYTFSSESVRHDRSPNIKNAMEKEINGLLARLTRFRTSLQETLDNGSQDSGGGSSMWIILYIYLVIYM